MALLTIEPGMLVWTWITFAVVLFIVWKFAWKTIAKALDARRDKVASDLDDAANARKEAERFRAEQESALEDARDKAQTIVVNAHAEAERARKEIVDKADEEARALKKHAALEIEKAKFDAAKDVQKEIMNVSLAIAKTALAQEIDETRHRDLVKEFMDKFEKN